MNLATIPHRGGFQMSRTAYPVFILIAISLGAVAFGFQATAPSAVLPEKLKEKIVFVRADPSIGVSSMRSITVAESGPGAIGDQANDGAGNSGGMVTVTHDAPDMQGRAVANPRTSEIALMNPDGTGIARLRLFGSAPMLAPA